MKTRGYGGKVLNKNILVKTDDPGKQQFYLTMTGKVSSIVDISPKVVSLSGTPGQALEAMVKISPAPDHSIKLLGMTQKFNKNIKAELVAPAQGGRDWLIKIKSFSDKADDFYDILTVNTDSSLKPQIKVRVYAIYQDKKIKSKS